MRGAVSAFAREHCGRRPSRRTLVLLAALCTLAVLTSAIGPWQRRGAARRCETEPSSPQPAEASPADMNFHENRESPDGATLAICTIVKVAADDPQWRDGRAEDVHEAREAELRSYGAHYAHIDQTKLQALPHAGRPLRTHCRLSVGRFTSVDSWFGLLGCFSVAHSAFLLL